MSFSEVSLLIIAGGLSLRMGEDKRWLPWRGSTFLEETIKQGKKAGFGEIIIAAASPQARLLALAKRYTCVIAYDEVPQSGPLGALYGALVKGQLPFACAISCDMPFWDFGYSARLLKAGAGKSCAARLQKQVQPFGAIYERKAALKAAHKLLTEGEQRLRLLWEKMPAAFLDFSARDAAFFNVNTPQALNLARGRLANLMRPVPQIVITAERSKTGKTTLISCLTRALSKRGIKVGVVKSDAHGFDLDLAGKDSWHFRRSGAHAVALVSPHGYFIVQDTDEKKSLLEIANLLKGVDLIFIESRTLRQMPGVIICFSDDEPSADNNLIITVRRARQKDGGIEPLANWSKKDSLVDLILFIAGIKLSE